MPVRMSSSPSPTPRRGVASPRVPSSPMSPSQSKDVPVSPAAAAAPAPALAVPSVFVECGNCRQHILSANFCLHEAHCTRNFQRCSFCNKLLPSSALATHCADTVASLAVLSEALARGDAARVQASLDHDEQRVSLAWADESGASLLHLAAGASNDRWDMQALVEQMLRMGADASQRNHNGLTPLHAAARAGAAASCSALIAFGADVHARASMGITAFEMCVGEEARNVLLQAGASLPGSNGASRQSSRGPSPHEGAEAAKPTAQPSDRLPVVGAPMKPQPPSVVRPPPSSGGLPSARGAASSSARLLLPVMASDPEPEPARPRSSRHVHKLRSLVQQDSGS
jgi:hypothetical protein